MKKLSITDILTATGGKLVGHDSGQLVGMVSTDTRSITDDALFVALRGENFDAHHFLNTAVDNGAACLLIDREQDEDLAVPTVLVEDTLQGLQDLAKWYRDSLDIKVVGITGSNGKTSTKDFTMSVLSQAYRVNATKGNFNNHIGLPLSILSGKEADQVHILEMGMNHAGEIAPLCEIASPDIGIITNIGTAHIEFLGSRENIAEEKSALGRCLPADGTLIFPGSSDFADFLNSNTQAKVLATDESDVFAKNITQTPNGSSFDLHIGDQEPIKVTLHVSGKHMVENALLAAAAGYSLGMSAVDIATGLNTASLTSGRLRRFECQGISVIDDTYNANPDSVIAAIETLADIELPDGAQRYIALGMMGELGVHAEAEHQRVGKFAAEQGLQVISVGAEAKLIYQGAADVDKAARHFGEASEAACWITKNCQKGDCVLFKGSRMAAMEKVMNEAFPQI